MNSRKEWVGMMRISGIGGGQDARTIAMPKTSDSNPELDNLQKQIDEKRKQMQELGKDESLPPEQKQKKRQSLEQEIAELEAQKNQAEMAAKQKERQEAEAKQVRHNDEAYSRSKDGDTALISARGMKAMITAGQAIEMADVTNGVKKSMEGEAGVLESEIKLDQASGADTTRKEQRLHEIEEKTSDLNRQSIADLDEANEELQSERTGAEKSADPTEQEAKENQKTPEASS